MWATSPTRPADRAAGGGALDLQEPDSATVRSEIAEVALQGSSNTLDVGTNKLYGGVD
jgi:hypothetical protein